MQMPNVACSTQIVETHHCLKARSHNSNALFNRRDTANSQLEAKTDSDGKNPLDWSQHHLILAESRDRVIKYVSKGWVHGTGFWVRTENQVEWPGHTVKSSPRS